MLRKAWEEYFKNRLELRRIAYCSKLCATLSDDDLSQIVLHAEARNRKLGITGVLFIDGSNTVQILEGQSNLVEDLYEEIAADPRHTDVTKGLDACIQVRAFAGWSMRLMISNDFATNDLEVILEILQTIDRSGLNQMEISNPMEARACSTALTRLAALMTDAVPSAWR